MLPPGTAVCWPAAHHQSSLRARVVAAIPAGIAPASAAPEIVGLKTTQLKFGDPNRPRIHDHYLVRRWERNSRGGEQWCYYLPPAWRVQSVTEQAPAYPRGQASAR